jgi:hypothetical protein
MRALLLALASLLGVSGSAPVWTRGAYTLLDVGSDAALSLAVGTGLAFTAPPPSPPPTSFATSNGTGPWGAYDAIAFSAPALGPAAYEVRYHAALDAFTFHYAVGASPFPFFAAATPASAAAGVISYSQSYMLPGSRIASLTECAAGGGAPAAPAASAGDPPQCPPLTGEWCCEAVAVTQAGSAVTSTAAWGNGTGTVSGRSIAMTFTNVGPQRGTLSADCSTIEWAPCGSTWQRASAAMHASDGPLLLFSAADPPDALAFSALDNFTVSSAGCGSSSSSSGSGGGGALPGFGSAFHPTGTPPPGAALAMLLLGRPGLKRASIAWGAALRRAYGASRRRGVGSRELSYWSDNAAGYSFWSVPGRLDTWGQPEAIFRALHAGYRALGIPIVQWEVDSNMLPGAPSPWFGGWCWKDWRHFNTTLYPSGGALSAAALGGAPMAYYVSAFCQDNVHGAEGFRFVNVSLPPGAAARPAAVAHPADAYRFYTSILAPAAREWNMQHFFTDFLCYRGPRLDAAMAAGGGSDAALWAPSAAWLAGMTLAASDLGMEVQYCMACAHQALQSLAFPAVTNARVNGDGGLDLRDLVFSTAMAAAVGLGWSKDNLRLAVFAAGVTEIQVALAALSLGPVGLSDELEGYPTPLPPGASPPVVTNVTLAMSTCTANGTLLQPSFPLTAVEDLLAGRAGLDEGAGHVWATFTAIPGGLGPWFTALAYDNSEQGGGLPPYALRPRHLAPLVDWGQGQQGEEEGGGACTPPTNPPDFASAPSGSFLGAGGALCGDFVAWDRAAPTAPAAPFSEAAPLALPLLPLRPAHFNIAPLVNGLAFLGEEGKVAAVSSHRFASIAAAAGGSAAVALRGAPGEAVTLLWAAAPALVIERKTVVLGEDGRAEVTVP